MDLILPCVLFAVREMAEASPGFTLFEMLYRRQLWGLIYVAWEEQHSPYCSVVEFVTEMQQGIEHIWPTVQEHMCATLEEQRLMYNQPMRPCEFHSGD